MTGTAIGVGGKWVMRHRGHGWTWDPERATPGVVAVSGNHLAGTARRGPANDGGAWVRDDGHESMAPSHGPHWPGMTRIPRPPSTTRGAVQS